MYEINAVNKMFNAERNTAVQRLYDAHVGGDNACQFCSPPVDLE